MSDTPTKCAEDIQTAAQWWDEIQLRPGFKELVWTRNALFWHATNTPLTLLERELIKESIGTLEDILRRPATIADIFFPKEALEVKFQ